MAALFSGKPLSRQGGRDIEANIPRNYRSADWQPNNDTPLDPDLYRRRLVIEQLNAWLDGFQTLRGRFETWLPTWLAFHWLAFTVRRTAATPTWPPIDFLNSFTE